MGMIFTDDIANYPRRLHIGAVIENPEFTHGEQSPAMDRLESVTDIRQRPPDNDAHGIVAIGFLQLLFDGDRRKLFCRYFIFIVHKFSNHMDMITSSGPHGGSLDVEVGHFQRMVLDKVAPGLHLVAHQRGEDVIRLFRI